MTLTEMVPGLPFSPAALARVLPGVLPVSAAPPQAPAVAVQGTAFVPVPGAPGRDAVQITVDLTYYYNIAKL